MGLDLQKCTQLVNFESRSYGVEERDRCRLVFFLCEYFFVNSRDCCA